MTDLTNKISEWLDKHGYPLEMYVASVFQKHGFQVAQSVNYTDSDSALTREIDLIAYKNFLIGHTWISFAFVIECKSTKSKPWLSFITKEKLLEYQWSNIYCTKFGETIINNMGIRRSLIEFLFPHGITKHSYSLTQAFRDGDAPDIPYKAIQAVTKSIDSFITQSDKNEKNLIYLYFPIIAIESPLFEVELLFTNEIEIKEVNQSAYLIRNSNNNISSILSVVTKSSISNFAENAAEKIAVFIPYYKDKILDLIISNK